MGEEKKPVVKPPHPVHSLQLAGFWCYTGNGTVGGGGGGG